MAHDVNSGAGAPESMESSEKKRLDLTRKTEKAKRKAEKKAARAARRERFRKINEPPRRSVLEEIGNSVTHGIGAALAICGTIILLVRSRSGLHTAAALIYGLCMIVLFLMSCLYHAFRGGSTVKRVFRRFDYSSIYLLIGGTFTPIFLLFLDKPIGLYLCIGMWAFIATGISLVGVFGPVRLKVLHTAMYIVLGWSALFFAPKMIREVPEMFYIVLAGGVAYTLGIIPFALKKKGSHFIWHMFVLAGAMLHYFAILHFLY